MKTIVSLKYFVNDYKSASQILFLKDEYTFPFSNFLIIGLCNSSANCYIAKSKVHWFDIILLLIAPPEELLSRIYQSLKQVHVDIHCILNY